MVDSGSATVSASDYDDGMGEYKWVMFGVLGAVCAAVVNVMSKKALDVADVFVALSLQSLLMLVTLCVSVTIMGRWGHLREMPRWAVGTVLLSGIAGGLSWTFGYQALQLSSVAKAGTIDKMSVAVAVLLAVVFLKERPTLLNWMGIGLMLVGAFCVAHKSAAPADAHRGAPAGGHRQARGESDPPQGPGLTAIGPGPTSAPDPQPVSGRTAAPADV